MNSSYLLAAVAVVVVVAMAVVAVLLGSGGPRYQGVGIGNNNLQIFVVDTASGAVRSCTIGNPQQGTPPRCSPWGEQ